jgi:hypothetical protein
MIDEAADDKSLFDEELEFLGQAERRVSPLRRLVRTESTCEKMVALSKRVAWVKALRHPGERVFVSSQGSS